MSTNINITVGGNSLVNQAKAQQQASRQAQLEKEARQRLEREAEIERVNALAAQGKDANGNTIAGAPRAPQFRPDEPAATRQLGSGFVLVPNATYGEYGYKAKTKNIANKNFTSRQYDIDGDYVDLPYPNFSVNEGPNNTPALLFNAQTEYYLEYAVCDNLNVIGYDRFNALVDTTSGMQQPVEIRQPLHEATEYTLEFFVYADNNQNPRTTLTVEFFYFDKNPSFGSDSRYWLAYIVFQVQSGIWVFRAFAYFGGGTTPDEVVLPVPATTWHHVAVVVKNNIYTCYFNGQQYITGSLLANIPVEPTIPSLSVDQNNLNNNLNTKMHGIRFSRKALYSGTSFTPPTNITRLA